MSFSMQVAARTLYGEARGEPEEGQRAVAHVLVNRMKLGRWGKTLAEVSMARKQFSCWNDDDPNRPKMVGLSDDDPLLVRLCEHVEDAMSGEPDMTNGATHYHAASMETYPAWALDATKCGQIGNHIFYKDVK